MTGDAPGSIRLDKWLWQARFFKSRALAARMVAAGTIRVNAVRVTKPATTVAVGDGLTFVQGGRVRVVRIRALGLRRGPAAEAQTLYEDLTDARRGPTGAVRPGMSHGDGSGGGA